MGREERKTFAVCGKVRRPTNICETTVQTRFDDNIKDADKVVALVVKIHRSKQFEQSRELTFQNSLLLLHVVGFVSRETLHRALELAHSFRQGVSVGRSLIEKAGDGVVWVISSRVEAETETTKKNKEGDGDEHRKDEESYGEIHCEVLFPVCNEDNKECQWFIW